MNSMPPAAYGQFFIAYDGQWFHDGKAITRKALAKLFSDRALTMDRDGFYWLKTPHEQYPVDVEDVPFVIVDYDIKGADINLITNMGEEVPLGPDHPLVLRAEPKRGDIVPYVAVRDGLMARLNRSVFTALAKRALENGGVTLHSRGMDHPLGEMA